MMKQNGQVTFRRAPKSCAIPIVNPGSRQTKPPLPATSKVNNTTPASLYPSLRDSSEKILSTQPINRQTGQRSEFQEATSRDPPSSGQALDVYARPFVTEAFTIINTQYGESLHTRSLNQIDFGTYVHNSFGLGFLPVIPRPINTPLNADFSLEDSLASSLYEKYFRFHLEAEFRSQQQENESYSLYGHEVAILPPEPGKPTTCTFSVPGLRENSPYIEEDDIIQLRQLRYDLTGRLLGMDQWLAPNPVPGWNVPGFAAPIGKWEGDPVPGWTGYIYNARASRVQRKQEQIFVKVLGLLDNQNYHLDLAPLKFNIQFHVPMERNMPMKQVLPIIQKALSNIGEIDNEYEDILGTAKTGRGLLSTLDNSSSTIPHGYAVKSRHWLQSALFPIDSDCQMQDSLNPWSFNRIFFDSMLNREQSKTVESVCSQNFGSLPFLISGPPGTGKTKTLVEIAVQLIKKVDKVSHLLFCAPSDPSADTIVQRLSHYFNPAELLRLNRPSRTFAEVSGAVLPFCYVSQDVFSLPPFKQLLSYNIIVTTCRDASLLLYSRMTNSDLFAVESGVRKAIHPYDLGPFEIALHWTALLIDESAQATEPEALIPLSVVAPPLESIKLEFSPLFVMAGDEYQLGPRTSLRSTPLKTSLFARLFARPVYVNHPLARGKTGKTPETLKKTMLPILRPAFSNLIRNYRSHPAILAVPSALFYADTLEPEAKDSERLVSWSGWRGKKWPVLFHDNDSEDELEKDGGGWYNIGEAQIACRYASLLVQTGLVNQNEVCIMSPFKAQVQCLRKTIRDQKYGSLWDVDIGPTEIFQGLERGVVILCTTRSKQRFVSKDKQLDWGIIGMANKMNVALTRAKFGLIVIGKREILFQDPNWKTFLEFCERNGLVSAENYNEEFVKYDDARITRLEKVLLAKERHLYMPEEPGEMYDGSEDIWEVE